jgi:hypothetical protein
MKTEPVAPASAHPLKTFSWVAAVISGMFAQSTLVSAGSGSGGKSPIESKGPVSVPSDLGPWGGPLFGGGAKSNDEFTEGNLFLVYPWLNTIADGGSMEGNVGFVEPYVSWGEGDEIGASLGLGMRHLFSNQSSAQANQGGPVGFFEEGLYVGANVFVDYLRTPNSSDFWQTGFGVEGGTRYIEVRGNYYLPWSDDRVLGSRNETTSYTTTSSTSSSSTSPTTIRNGRFVQDVARTTRTSTSTTTRQRTFERFEEPLEGWDVEAAVLMPFIDQYFDLQLVGGYHQFSGDRSRSSDLEGWRAGIEIRPVPALVLHVTWYENDRLYQSDWLAGFSVELPLGGDWRESFTPRRRHLAERLFEPVRRKNANITTGEEEELTSDSTTTTTSSSSENSRSSVDLGPIPRSSPPVPMQKAPPSNKDDQDYEYEMDVQ